MSHVGNAGGTLGADALSERVLAGARLAVARWGWRRTSVDDIARIAGLSRASVYRAFPGGREPVLQALVESERRSLSDTIALARRSELDATLVALTIDLGDWFRSNTVLATVLRHEPDLIGRWLGFEAGERLLGEIADVIASMLAPLAPDLDLVDLGHASVQYTRHLRSHLLDPSPYVALADPASVERFVRVFLLPMFEPRTGSEHRSGVGVLA